MVANGADMREICMAHFGNFIRYTNGIAKAKLLFDSSRADACRPEPKIAILWSTKSGTGKSAWAREYYPVSDCAWISITNPKALWIDGYSGEDTIVFDEFIPNKCNYGLLLQLLDRGPLALEKKGSKEQVFAYKFVFTSNFCPRYWYPQQPELQRRLDQYATILELGPLGDDGTINVVNRTTPTGGGPVPKVGSIGPLLVGRPTHHVDPASQPDPFDVTLEGSDK